MKNRMTIKEAVFKWVGELNSIPTDMIKALVNANQEEWEEVTVPNVGNQVYIYNIPMKDIYGFHCKMSGQSGVGEILELDDSDYIVKIDDGATIKIDLEDFDVKREDILPMWSTMWSFKDISDCRWLEERDGIKAMSECGFRIYKHKDWGYFFGIDGGGYDFYDEHWIPAYNELGLKWHTEE